MPLTWEPSWGPGRLSLNLPVFILHLIPPAAPKMKVFDLFPLETLTTLLLLHGVRAVARPQGWGKPSWWGVGGITTPYTDLQLILLSPSHHATF